MVDRVISALLRFCIWLERWGKPEQTPVATQPYETVPTEPEPETVEELVGVVYLHRPENMPVQCSCVERRNGVLTTRPSCKRCRGFGAVPG